MDDLNKKVDKLSKDVIVVGNMYDYIYYMVVVNFDCVKKVLDKLLSDFFDKVEKDIIIGILDISVELVFKIVV